MGYFDSRLSFPSFPYNPAPSWTPITVLTDAQTRFHSAVSETKGWQFLKDRRFRTVHRNRNLAKLGFFISGRTYYEGATGEVVHVIRKKHWTVKSLRIFTKVGVVGGLGFVFGMAAAAMTRSAAWAALNLNFGTAATYAVSSWAVPFAASSIVGSRDPALALVFGLGTWAGARFGHAKWAYDMVPDMDIAAGKRLFKRGQDVFKRTGKAPWWHRLGRKVAEGTFDNPFAKDVARRSLTPGVSVW